MKSAETPKKKPRCRHISKIGSRCHADPQTGKDYCFFHDPEQKKKQAEARKQGGEVRSRQTEPELTLPPNLPDVRLEKSGDVFELMEETVYHLQCGTMDVRAANALAYLASLLLRTLKAGRPRIAKLLADTINRVRQGETDLRTAKTIGHLTSIMLTALKQEAEEGQVGPMVEMPAIRPAEPMRANLPTRNSAADVPSNGSVQALIAAIAAVKPPDNPELHPAVTTGATAGTARSKASHA